MKASAPEGRTAASLPGRSGVRVYQGGKVVNAVLFSLLAPKPSPPWVARFHPAYTGDTAKYRSWQAVQRRLQSTREAGRKRPPAPRELSRQTREQTEG